MLPQVKTWERYRELWSQAEPWEPAKLAICRLEALEPAGFKRVARGGTHVVWAKPGYLVLKLHCPFFPDASVEQTVTRFMAGRLTVSAPELVSTGEIEGWPYTVITWLPGVGLGDVWPDLDSRGKSRIAFELGLLVRSWHDASNVGIPIPDTGWADFIKTRLAATATLQRATGLDERLIRQIPAFLEPFIDEFRNPPHPVMLHWDFKREHIRVSQKDGAWRLSGLIDFGDATVGHAEYDFFDATLSLIPPDREVLRAFFDGYGQLERYALKGGTERLLAWALLHNDMGVTNFLRSSDRTASATSLQELAEELLPL